VCRELRAARELRAGKRWKRLVLAGVEEDGERKGIGLVRRYVVEEDDRSRQDEG
jgi:hypothetical protein